MTKDALGAEYADYNLVVAGPLGMPTEQSTINGALKQLIDVYKRQQEACSRKKEQALCLSVFRGCPKRLDIRRCV